MFAVKVGLFPSSAAVSDSIPWDSHRNRSHHQSREVVCTSQHPSHWACGLCYLPSTKSSLLLKLLLPGVLPAPTPTCIWRGQMWGALTSMQTCCPFVLNQNKQIHTRTPPNHPPTSFLLPTATPFFCSSLQQKSSYRDGDTYCLYILSHPLFERYIETI